MTGTATSTPTELGKQKEDRIAYSIPLPYNGAQLGIRESANAWWMDQSKITSLITSFRFTATIPEACVVAGITVRQYKYFISLHPTFNDIRKAALLTPGMAAKMTIVRAITGGDLKTSRWYLERSEPERFGSPARIKSRKLREWEERKQQQMEPGIPGVTVPYPEDMTAVQKFDELLEENRRKKQRSRLV